MFLSSPSQQKPIYKPNSVSRRVGMAIIHLVQLLPDWIKRSTRRSYPDKSEFGRAALLTPPYLILHCEEFAWPRRVTTRAGALLH